MLRPVVNPLEIVPIATMPVRGGAKVTTAPGTAVKVLFGAVEAYNWAVIVTVEPTSACAAVVLKYALIDVMVPVLGTLNPKFINVPGPPVRSMVPPIVATPEAEFPKPTKAEVFSRPPSTVVIVIGSPEA